MSSTQKSVTTGIFYTALSKYSGIGLTIVITSILARLITPAEFGIVAIALVFITFFQLLSDFGIGPAIIQSKALSERDIKSIFFFTIIIGFLGAALFYTVAPIISAFYNQDALTNVLRYLSLALFLYACNIVPKSLNYKRLLFKKIGVIQIVVQAITGALAIVLAFRGMGYMALVIRSLLDSFLIFLGSYYLSPLGIHFKIEKSALKKIYSFASYQFLFNFINYFSRNADNLLIGKVFGAAPLGLYDKSYRLMMMPVQNLTHVITPVLLPVLSDFQNDYSRIYKAYEKVVKVLATIGFPLSVFLYFSGEQIITILYGNQWIAAIPVFKILSLSIGIQMVLSSSGSIFQAINRTDLLFKSGLLSAFVMLTAIIYGVYVKNEIYFIPISLLIAFIINFNQGFYILIHIGLKKSFKNFLKIFYFPLISTLIIGFEFKLVEKFLIIDSHVIFLILKSVLFGISFFVILLFNSEFKMLLLNFYKNKIRGKNFFNRKK
ncbi:lipopolysaccharide biosynthesis protein [Leeuwenhoekiella aequorea]|uniref:PST family polysaccharide transporter n=1 Tax=Leeuwenhoekiella aequorea TaxID=283736 RepID=A0A4Q0P1S8_9FLAO|nr:lipopolysaccharide biosynthesis protein [Leeuwenhoekiella aequorea]RXG20450.1 PST family polysaccharide transporter [Leeuwenhoekiella aequorea]